MDDTNASTSKMNPMIIAGVVIVIAVVGLFLAKGAGKNGDKMKPAEETNQEVVAEPTTEETTPAVENTADTKKKMEKGVKEFKVEGSNFAFNVKEIKVKKGDTVKIVFKNTEGFHNWELDEFKAKTKQLKEGGSETITFVADKAGTYEYYCSVGKHRQNGMVGKLIVE